MTMEFKAPVVETVQLTPPLVAILAFENYQKQALVTASMGKGREIEGLVRVTGLCGESAEFADEWAKWITLPLGGLNAPTMLDKLKKELGDVMWYAATIAEWLGVTLNFDFYELQVSAGRRTFTDSAPVTLMKRAGALAEFMKKHVGHDKPLDGRELGLVLEVWYAIAFCANTIGFELPYVAAENIRKLRMRHHGGGFTAAAQNAKADELHTPVTDAEALGDRQGH